MATVHPAGDLEIHEDPDGHERAWKVQKVGWAVTALLLLAAMLGLCGSSGPLNKTSAGDESSITLLYPRFVRHGATSALQVRAAGSVTTSETFRLVCDRTFLDRLEVRQVIPEPEDTVVGVDEVTYVFKVAERGRPVEITFDVEPSDYGLLSGWFSLEAGQPVRFRQFVYP